MIVLWFILGIALIFGIARYNESNKLFWTLLLSFIIGFAGTKMFYDICNDNGQSNDNLTQVYPTHAQPVSTNAAVYYIADKMLTEGKVVTAHQLVSQGLTPATSEIEVTLSEIFGRTRDQPQLLTTKPPEKLCLQKDFLILHDTG